MEIPYAQALIALLGFLAPRVLEWIKTHPWIPLLDAQRPTLNRLVSVIVAIAQAVGVTFAFSGETLVVNGLNLESILTLGFNAALAFLVQQLQFRAAISPKAA